MFSILKTKKILLLLGFLILIIALATWYFTSRPTGTQSKTTTSNPVVTPEPTTPDPQPQVDPNAGYIVIKEWGVRFKPADGLNGVEYFTPEGNSSSVSIISSELAQKEPRCGRNSDIAPIGLLTRSTALIRVPAVSLR